MLQVIKILLIPVSVVYSVIIFFRNKFYDYGIIKTRKISRPVISTGNITTGGTGKTPLTIHIARYFLDKGISAGIISRGYGRNSGEILTVCNGNDILVNADKSGDELSMISEELLKNYKGKFYIVAGADRIKAAEHLLKNFNAGIIILDDAFQYRKIFRDTDIAVIDAQDFSENRSGYFFTVPSGMLREYMSGLKRADVIVQNNKASDYGIIPELKQFSQLVISMRYKTEYIIDFKNSILTKSGFKAVVFSGIANDESFLKLINNEGIDIRDTVKFPDHHKYSDSDIEMLKAKYSEDTVYITTEKDFVKVKQFRDFTEKFPVYYLKLKTEITLNENIFYHILDNALNENRSNKN